MNNLQRNYFSYKDRQGVFVALVDKDGSKSKKGRNTDDLGNTIALQNRTTAIMESNVIDQRTFIGVLEDKNASKSITQTLLLSYERHQIEFFNRRVLCKEDVYAFLDGKHERVRLLERLLFLHQEESELHTSVPSLSALRKEQVLQWLESRDLKTKMDRPLDLKAFAWGELFASTPFFHENQFLSVEISTEDLKSFVAKVKEYRWVFDTLLVPLRRDVYEKPIRFLGDRLKDVGLNLKTSRVDQRGGKKTYFYRLDQSLVNSTLQLLAERQAKPSFAYIPHYWKAIHEEYGFDTPVYERIDGGAGTNIKVVWSVWQGDIEGEFEKRRVGHQKTNQERGKK